MLARELPKSVAIGVILVLAGCAAPEDAGEAGKPIEATFVCGPEIARTRFQAEQMLLTLDAKQYVLRRARSASGARYTGISAEGPVEFWNKGREAKLTIGDVTLPLCRQHGDTR